MQNDWQRTEAQRLRNKLGAVHLGNGRCLFRVWAPEKKSVEVHITCPEDRIEKLSPAEFGYWEATLESVEPGARYMYRLDGKVERPDPASRCQPDGVHKASQVIDTHFNWTDQKWFGIPLTRHVLYELHVGTFTQEGTFEAIIPHLETLRDLGVTAVELMPVAQFPGKRNWGYDGVYPYAVQNSYGGAKGLKTLVNAAHQVGLAVILDVVYNHVGPEGNYLGEYGPYFTDAYKTPWGQAINYDGPCSEEVRRFFVNNATEWIEDYHIDGLRLDATHFIFDTSASPFLRYLAKRVKQTADCVNRRVYLFAETDANDTRWVTPQQNGGFGMNAQWNDDFQHALYTMLPNADARAYLNDFGEFSQLVKSFREGYVYTGEYSPFRKRRHGNSSRDVHGKRLVVFAQNHDQVGNRPMGDRMCMQVSPEGVKLAAGSVILSPYLPLLFMGEEHAEEKPFLYFVDHGDERLIEAVRQGRKEEFAHMMEGFEPPDPQDPKTMQQCIIDHTVRTRGHHKHTWEFHRELLRLRRELGPLTELSKESYDVRAFETQRTIVMHRRDENDEVLVILCYSPKAVELSLSLEEGTYTKILDSAEKKWGGAGTTAADVLSPANGTAGLKLPGESVTMYLRSRSQL